MKHPILIVDDDQLILNTLKKRLESWETDIQIASTPQEAKDSMSKVVPELVILDLLLTESDGSSGILDFMQSKENLVHVPVIILTNLDKPELKNMLLSQGRVKEYLIKGSLDLDDLVKKVWGYLEPGK